MLFNYTGDILSALREASQRAVSRLSLAAKQAKGRKKGSSVFHRHYQHAYREQRQRYAM